MNKVILIGRITKDVEVKNTSSQTPFTQFSVAVDRKYKDANGQRQADFINCVAWRNTATFISQYFHKGSKIAIVGTLQTRSYEQNGNKVFITEVLVEEAEFVESKQGNTQPKADTKPVAPSMADSAPAEPSDLPFEF